MKKIDNQILLSGKIILLWLCFLGNRNWSAVVLVISAICAVSLSLTIPFRKKIKEN